MSDEAATTETQPQTTPTDDGGDTADKSLMDGKGDGIDAGKPADEKPADRTADRTADEPNEDKGDAPAEPPEKYELTPPEGFEVNDELLAEADPVFREIGLSNEAANKLMPLVGKVAERIVSAQNDAFQAQATDWAKEAKADAEIGGRNWAETENLVAKALDRFGAPEGSPFRQLLNESKLGNHPEMIRMFRKVGAAIGEGGDFTRGDAVPEKKTGAAAMYAPEFQPKA